MDIGLLFLVVFIAGTLFLLKSRYERHFIVFLIRTKHFINFIDSLARISPRMWKFLADFAIILSFSGLGAAYLSRYRKFSRNLDAILLIIGFTAAILWLQDLPLFLFSLLILVIGIKSLSKIQNPNADFLVTATLISVIWLNMLPWAVAVLEGMFGLIIIIFAPLIENAFAITTGESTMPGVSPVILIPFKIAGEWCFPIPGMGICIPVFYGLIALILLLIVHEFAHGILARVQKLKLKSTGLLTLGIIPIGAFVEPDEEEFQRSESLIKTRVLGMGSFANLILGIVTLFLFGLIALPSTLIVAESSVPQIDINTRIEHIEGIPIKTISTYRSPYNTHLFHNKIWTIDEKSIEDKEGVDIITDKGIFLLSAEDAKSIKMRAQPRFRYNYRVYGINIFEILTGILFWSFFFNINIALINLLPIPPFDGGKMLIELMSIFNIGKITVRRVVSVVILIGLLLLLVNAFPLINMLTEYIEGLIECYC